MQNMFIILKGVMRKLLNIWFQKTHGPHRLPHQLQAEVSHRMLMVASMMPREFARRPRSLTELDRFKATELRQLLLYTGKQCNVHVNSSTILKLLYIHFFEKILSKFSSHIYLCYRESNLQGNSGEGCLFELPCTVSGHVYSRQSCTDPRS